MTNRLIGLGGSFLASDSRLQAWRSIRAAAGCIAVFMVGCGGEDSTTTTTTSHQDIAAYIQEHPEFGNTPAASARSSESSDSTTLGLER